MNTVIIYSSKYGCTADCARYLEAGLSGSKTMIDIDRTDLKSIDLKQFDTVVIGSSIYIGAVSKKIRALCTDQEALLLAKRVGLFLCCGFPEQIQQYFSTNFSKELLEKAIASGSFGGETRLAQMKFADKLIMKAVTKGSDSTLKISREEMDSFIKILNS